MRLIPSSLDPSLFRHSAVSISIEAYLLAISIGEIAAFGPFRAGIVSRKDAKTQRKTRRRKEEKKKRREEEKGGISGCGLYEQFDRKTDHGQRVEECMDDKARQNAALELVDSRKDCAKNAQWHPTDSVLEVG